MNIIGVYGGARPGLTCERSDRATCPLVGLTTAHDSVHAQVKALPPIPTLCPPQGGSALGIRQPAAEKLVRQLLELRLTRVNALSDQFVSAMAKIVITHVDLDEQHQRRDEIMNGTPAALENTSKEKP